MRIRKSLPFALAAAAIAGVGYFMWQPGQTAALKSAIQGFAGNGCSQPIRRQVSRRLTVASRPPGS